VLITAEVLELSRDGKPVAEIMSIGPTILPLEAVMEGVSEMIDVIEVEGTFRTAPNSSPCINPYGDAMTPGEYFLGVGRDALAHSPAALSGRNWAASAKGFRDRI
jgi:urease subunit gamma/beta